MTCYYPMPAWYSAEKNASGKRSIIFQPEGGFGLPFKVPCGKCIGCRLDRSQDWCTRLIHEAQFHDRKSFVTLTYAPEHLPENGSLNVRDVQLFLKRLRQAATQGVGPHAFPESHRERVRFFAVGEYGERLERPHYHLMLFGVDFAHDRKVCGVSKAAHSKRYRSASLEGLWGMGHCEVGMVTPMSAGYVARYSMKKVYGEKAEEWYKGRKPEFLTCSKGIGRQWWELYGDHSQIEDFVVVDHKPRPVPAYYDKLTAEDRLEEIKAKRKERALEDWRNNTERRLRIREEVKAAKVKSLIRRYDSGS